MPPERLPVFLIGCAVHDLERGLITCFKVKEGKVDQDKNTIGFQVPLPLSCQFKFLGRPPELELAYYDVEITPQTAQAKLSCVMKRVENPAEEWKGRFERCLLKSLKPPQSAPAKEVYEFEIVAVHHPELFLHRRDLEPATRFLDQLGKMQANAPESKLPAGGEKKVQEPEQQQDRILLKRGDILFGRLLLDKFLIKRHEPEGTYTFTYNRWQIGRIIFGPQGADKDMLVFRDSDNGVEGNIDFEGAKLKLPDGKEISLEKDQVKEIQVSR